MKRPFHVTNDRIHPLKISNLNTFWPTSCDNYFVRETCIIKAFKTEQAIGDNFATIAEMSGMTDSGVIMVSGVSDLSSATDITLDNAANDFGAAVSVSATNVTLVDVNALDLGASTVTGNLLVAAGADVTDSGSLNVAGSSDFTTTAANGSITLDNDNTFSGAVSAAADGSGNVSITNVAGDLNVSTISANDVSLQAEDSILDANGSAANITAADTISLAATTGTIGTTGQALSADAPTLEVSAGGYDAGLTSINVLNSFGTLTFVTPPAAVVQLNNQWRWYELVSQRNAVASAQASFINASGNLSAMTAAGNAGLAVMDAYSSSNPQMEVRVGGIPEWVGSMNNINFMGIKLPAGLSRNDDEI